MKFHCRVDTIHFADEYEKTLKPPCNFWGDMGMGNVPNDLKKKFWDWLFSMPSDEISIVCDLGISVEFRVGVIKPVDKFINRIEGYEYMNEHEQQDLQKRYFELYNQGIDMDAWIADYNKKARAEKRKN